MDSCFVTLESAQPLKLLSSAAQVSEGYRNSSRRVGSLQAVEPFEYKGLIAATACRDPGFPPAEGSHQEVYLQEINITHYDPRCFLFF